MTVGNGELKFNAYCTASSASYGFGFVFRVDAPASPTSMYRFHVRSETGFTYCTFERYYREAWYVLTPSLWQANAVGFGSQTAGTQSLDFTKLHEYRIVVADSWMYAFIDGVMVLAWNDNNSTIAVVPSSQGYWGWYSDANTTLYVNQITGTAFWKQIPSLAINAGDDMLSTITQFLQSAQAWFFSDIMGRLKALFLSHTDAPTYTYSNQLSAQGVDASDKEYVSQVTVYGNGVSATAVNNSLMAGVPVREQVIVDYTILTTQDAQNAANLALTNANQYQSQLNPKQTMNVGAELFDAVTVVNTGNNSSGINQTTRVYAETFTTGGNNGNNEFSLEVDTGTI